MLVVTDAFLPLAVAQAAVRQQEVEMVVVTHPVGGLEPGELAHAGDRGSRRAESRDNGIVRPDVVLVGLRAWRTSGR